MTLSSPTKAKPSYASCRRDEGGIPRASESRSSAVGCGVRGMGILGVSSERERGARRDLTYRYAGRVETRGRASAVMMDGFDGMM